MARQAALLAHRRSPSRSSRGGQPVPAVVAAGVLGAAVAAEAGSSTHTRPRRRVLRRLVSEHAVDHGEVEVHPVRVVGGAVWTQASDSQSRRTSRSRCSRRCPRGVVGGLAASTCGHDLGVLTRVAVGVARAAVVAAGRAAALTRAALTCAPDLRALAGTPAALTGAALTGTAPPDLRRPDRTRSARTGPLRPDRDRPRPRRRCRPRCRSSSRRRVAAAAQEPHTTATSTTPETKNRMFIESPPGRSCRPPSCRPYAE